MNVDASFTEDDHTGSCGAIIRDSRGMFVGASTLGLAHVADIVSGESAALVEGLKLALNIGCNSIFIQMNNMIVVEALNTGYSMIAAAILDECRSMLEEFEKFLLSIVIENPPSMWLDPPPGFISSLLANEVSVI